jgi:hypothetical protein
MEAEKSGKIKLTVELEMNEPLMELIKTDVEAVAKMVAEGMGTWRERMGQGGGMGGHGMGMMMHHGKE